MKTATATIASPKVISQMSDQAQRIIAQAKAKTIDVKKLQANDVEKDDQEEVRNPEKVKTPKVTKKSVIIEMISTPDGSTIAEMGQAIVDKGIDPDLAKNLRVCRLWLIKLGMPVKRDKETGRYTKA